MMVFVSCDDALQVEANPNITQVFMVGDALKGWTNYDKTPLAQPMLRTGDTVFEYRGNLTAGFLKISCDEIPDWDGHWFLPPKFDTVLNTGRELPMTYSPSGDGGETGAKWEITESAQYTVTLNKAGKTIKCEKTGGYMAEGTADTFSHMWLIICNSAAPQSFEMVREGGNWIAVRQRFLSGTYVKFYGESIPRTNWDAPYSLKWFCPIADGAPIPDDAAPDSADNKKFTYGADNTFAWKSPAVSAFYKVTLRPAEGTLAFVEVP